MGYAFLPIAVGFLIAGQIGGRLVHYFGDVRHAPAQLWVVVCGIGLATSLALIVYDRIVVRGSQSGSTHTAFAPKGRGTREGTGSGSGKNM